MAQLIKKKICIEDIFKGTTLCKDPVVDFKPLFNPVTKNSDLAINCVGTCAEVEFLDTGVDLCLYVIVECKDCDNCAPPLIKEVCFSNGQCPPCHDNINNVCVNRCEGKLCDEVNNVCVDCLPGTCQGDKECIGGKCQCPPSAPYDAGNNICLECIDNQVCKDKYGPCAECIGGKCVIKDCASGKCHPVTGNCVECVKNSDCSGENKCCDSNGNCVCCPGYYLDPVTKTCVPKPPCFSNSDCKDCETCDSNGNCVPIVCPAGYLCVGGECYKECECNKGPCSATHTCIPHPTLAGKCYCKACTGGCPDGNCGEGCICDQNKVCVPNPCGNTCSGPNDCGPDCGCYNGKCTPCSTLNCTNCSNAVGCGCDDGVNCEDKKDECDPSNAGLQWTKVCPEGEITGGGLSKVVPTYSVTNCHQIQKDSTKGDFYEGCTFSYSTDVTGTWTYYPQSGSGTNVGSNTKSVTFTHGSGAIADNILGWRLVFEASDGRKVTFQTVNSGSIKDADWNTSVVSNTTPGGTNSAGPCLYKLCPTDPNFNITNWAPVNEKYTTVQNKQLQLNLKKVEGGCFTFEILGCGTYQGQLPLSCFGRTVLADIPLFDNNACCDLSKPNCSGGPGECVGESITVPLIAEAYYGGDGKNDFVVRPDLSKIPFEKLFFITDIKWTDKSDSNGNSDIDRHSELLDQGGSQLYQNISFQNGGCVNFSASSGCDTLSGEICVNKCTDFSLKLVELGNNAYKVFPSTPYGDTINYTVTPSTRLVGSASQNGNFLQFTVDITSGSNETIVVTGKYGDTSCTATATINPQNECCISISVEQVDEGTDVIITLSNTCTKFNINEISASYTKNSSKNIISPTEWVYGGGVYTITIAADVNDIISAEATRNGLCPVSDSVSVVNCDLGINVSKTGCNYKGTVRSDLTCSCDLIGKFKVERAAAQTQGNVVLIPFTWSAIELDGRTIKSATLTKEEKKNGNIVSSKTQVSTVSSNTGNITAYFDQLNSGDIYQVIFNLSGITLDDNCQYNGGTITFTFSASGNIIPTTSDAAYQQNIFSLNSGSYRKPELTWKDDDGVLLKKEWATSSTLENPDLGTLYQFSAECGCRQSIDNIQMCLDSSISGVLSQCNNVLTINATTCYLNAPVRFTIAGEVIDLTTSATGTISNHVHNLSSTITGTSQMLVEFLQAPSKCSKNVTVVAATPYIPNTTITCQGATYDIEVTNATNIVITVNPGGASVSGNTIVDVPDTASISFTAEDATTGCTSNVITITKDCGCTLENVFGIPDHAGLCEDQSQIKLTNISFSPNGSYEYRIDGGAWATAGSTLFIPNTDATILIEYQVAGAGSPCWSKEVIVETVAIPTLTLYSAPECVSTYWEGVVLSTVTPTAIDNNGSTVGVTNLGGGQYVIGPIAKGVLQVDVKATNGGCNSVLTLGRPSNCIPDCNATDYAVIVPDLYVLPCSTTASPGKIKFNIVNAGCGGGTEVILTNGLIPLGNHEYQVPTFLIGEDIQYTSSTTCGCVPNGGYASVSVTDSCGGADCSSVAIDIDFGPIVGTIQASPGDEIDVTASVTGGTAPYTYAWTRTGSSGYFTCNGGGSNYFNIIGGNPGSNHIVIKASDTWPNNTSVKYVLSVVDANGCKANRSFEICPVSVAPCALSSLVINGSTTLGCEGGSNQTTSLTASVGNNPLYTYTWSGPGGFSSSSYSINVNVAGQYTLYVYQDQNCYATRTVQVVEDPCCGVTCPACQTCSGGGCVSTPNAKCGTVGCCSGGNCIDLVVNTDIAGITITSSTMTITNVPVSGVGVYISSCNLKAGTVYNSQPDSTSAATAVMTPIGGGYYNIVITIPAAQKIYGYYIGTAMTAYLTFKDSCGNIVTGSKYWGMYIPGSVGTASCATHITVSSGSTHDLEYGVMDGSGNVLDSEVLTPGSSSDLTVSGYNGLVYLYTKNVDENIGAIVGSGVINCP